MNAIKLGATMLDKKSLDNLSTCHPDLKRLVKKVAETKRISVRDPEQPKKDDGYRWTVSLKPENESNYPFIAGFVEGLALSLGLHIRHIVFCDFELVKPSKKEYLPDEPTEDEINMTLEEIERTILD